MDPNKKQNNMKKLAISSLIMSGAFVCTNNIIVSQAQTTNINSTLTESTISIKERISQTQKKLVEYQTSIRDKLTFHLGHFIEDTDKSIQDKADATAIKTKLEDFNNKISKIRQELNDLDYSQEYNHLQTIQLHKSSIESRYKLKIPAHGYDDCITAKYLYEIEKFREVLSEINMLVSDFEQISIQKHFITTSISYVNTANKPWDHLQDDTNINFNDKKNLKIILKETDLQEDIEKYIPSNYTKKTQTCYLAIQQKEENRKTARTNRQSTITSEDSISSERSILSSDIDSFLSHSYLFESSIEDLRSKQIDPEKDIDTSKANELFDVLKKLSRINKKLRLHFQNSQSLDNKGITWKKEQGQGQKYVINMPLTKDKNLQTEIIHFIQNHKKILSDMAQAIAELKTISIPKSIIKPHYHNRWYTDDQDMINLSLKTNFRNLCPDTFHLGDIEDIKIEIDIANNKQSPPTDITPPNQDKPHPKPKNPVPVPPIPPQPSNPIPVSEKNTTNADLLNILLLTAISQQTDNKESLTEHTQSITDDDLIEALRLELKKISETKNNLPNNNVISIKKQSCIPTIQQKPQIINECPEEQTLSRVQRCKPIQTMTLGRIGNNICDFAENKISADQFCHNVKKCMDNNIKKICNINVPPKIAYQAITIQKDAEFVQFNHNGTVNKCLSQILGQDMQVFVEISKNIHPSDSGYIKAEVINCLIDRQQNM